VIVVIEMTHRGFVFRKPFDRRTVRQENIRPTIIVIIENDGAVARGFDNVFLPHITAVSIECHQTSLAGNILKMDWPGLNDWFCYIFGGRLLGSTASK